MEIMIRFPSTGDFVNALIRYTVKLSNDCAKLLHVHVKYH